MVKAFIENYRDKMYEDLEGAACEGDQEYEALLKCWRSRYELLLSKFRELGVEEELGPLLDYENNAYSEVFSKALDLVYLLGARDREMMLR